MKSAPSELHYDGPVVFFERLGITFRFGMKLLKMKVLRSDAKCNGKPIFLADTLSLERQRRALINHRATVRAAQENLIEAMK
jgi:hypothetical protein